MVKFIGEYSAKIDDKGRLVLPAAFKAAMSAAVPGTTAAAPEAVTAVPGTTAAAPEATPDMRLIIKKDIYEPCLEVFTFEEWEKRSEELKGRLNFLNREHAMFWRAYMHGRAMVEPDGKLGRITIPKKLLDSIGADKEVMFCGNDHKIEIWAKEKFESNMISDEDFVTLAGKLSD